MEAREFAQHVDSFLRPATFPLAIRMLAPGEVPPAKVKQPKRDLNIEIAVCQAVSMARRYGWTLAVGREDVNCVLTKTAFGFEKELPYYSEGNCACGMYTETKAAGAKTEAATHKFPHGKYDRILVGPAARADYSPDVLLMYGNSAQVLRLVTAALWKRGGALTSSFTGRLDCSDEIIRTIESQDYQVILPCYGDRVFAHTEDWEMAFSLPASKMEELVDGLKGTYAGGIRYPIPTFLRYSPQYPEKYNELARLWAEEKK
ncbi:MAG TPA: DUF169 domain-containing protein [Candidatus Acidoferrales bacterium]